MCKTLNNNDNVTYTKAFAIVLMVLVHSGAPSYIDRIVTMFHMPLFFLMSGFVFKEKYLTDILTFLKKRIVGLYVPFVKYGGGMLLLHNVFYKLGIYSSCSGYNNFRYGLNDFISRIIGLISFKYSEQLLGGYWFLPALFWGSIISIIALKMVKNAYLAAFTVFLLGFVLGQLFEHQMHTFRLCEKYFMVSFLFIVGHILSKKKIKPFNFYQSIVAFLFVYVGSFYWFMSMTADYYSTVRVFPYMLTAILGTWCVYSWCKMLLKYREASKLVLFIGNNTLTILTWHFLCFKFISVIIVVAYDLDFNMVGCHPVIMYYSHKGWFLIYAFIGIFMPLMIAYLKKYIIKFRKQYV